MVDNQDSVVATTTDAASTQQGASTTKKDCPRFALLQHYLAAEATLLTLRDLDEFAKANSYDAARVKLLNAALVKEGFLKMRKPAAAGSTAYYWLAADVGRLLERAREQYSTRV